MDHDNTYHSHSGHSRILGAFVAWRRFACLFRGAPHYLSSKKRLLGYTLIELMLVTALIGIIAVIALPGYQTFVERAKMAEVILDMGIIGRLVDAHAQETGALPHSLSEIGWTKPDRWGNPYYYLNMQGASIGQKRKDRSLHPLNSDYDLYSAGPDGKTTTPLTAKISQDDIIRANNGAYIGIAKNY